WREGRDHGGLRADRQGGQSGCPGAPAARDRRDRHPQSRTPRHAAALLHALLGGGYADRARGGAEGGAPADQQPAMTGPDRRRWLLGGLAALGTGALWRPGRLAAAGPHLTLAPDVPTRVYDFETSGIDGWLVVAGRWAVEDLPDAPKGRKGLVQRATGNVFRYDQGRYYVVRANALEDNFRLYYYDRGRRQIASANVKAPALGGGTP